MPGMLGFIALAGAAGLLFVSACGGQEHGGSSDGGGSGSSSGGRAGSSSGVSNPTWDGGLLPPTQPGHVRCGATVCSPGNECCLAEQGNPASNGCDSRSLPTCNGTQSVRDCDKQADCHPNEDCCISEFTSPPATLGSLCGPKGSCEYVGCASNADCADTDAGGCIAQRCRGDILQTCGLIATEECPP